MPDPVASWYRERNRVWLRMEIDEADLNAIIASLYRRGHDDLADLIVRGEREKTDQQDVMSRFDDAPPLD